MTEIYDINSMPHMVDIKCPSCGVLTEFEFAELTEIKLKKDIPFFESSNLFDYHSFKDSYGQKWHGAIFYAKLHGGSTGVIRDLPEGYSRKNWDHSKYLYRSHGTDLGAYCCSHCQTRKKYVLNWPDDAFFSIAHKGNVLWAFNLESTIDLRDYLASSDRKIQNYKWSKYLLHIPGIFKTKKIRDGVIKKLNELLS